MKSRYLLVLPILVGLLTSVPLAASTRVMYCTICGWSTSGPDSTCFKAVRYHSYKTGHVNCFNSRWYGSKKVARKPKPPAPVNP